MTEHVTVTRINKNLEMADAKIREAATPQKLHFQMFFAVVRALGWTRPQGARREVTLEHVSFGSVLGEDRKPLKTRSGENVKLREIVSLR